MDIKILLTVFVTVFLAELGDKTMVCTMLFATEKDVSGWTVFLGSSLALISASGCAVLFGCALSDNINPKYMSILAGSGFLLIGGWMLYKGLTSS